MLNAVAERDSGRSAIEQLGQPFTRLFPTGGDDSLLERYLDVLRTRKVIHFDYQRQLSAHLAPDWFNVLVIPVENSLVISYQNVTQDMESDELVLLRQAFDASLSGVAVLKAIRNASGRITDFRIVRFNPAFQQALGPMASDAPNQLITQFVKGGRELGLLSRCIMCVEMGNVHRFELSYNLLNRTHWYQASMTPTGDQVILTITDFTEAKQAQLAYHLQAELLKSINDTTPAGLVLWEAIRDNGPERLITNFRYRMTNQMNNMLTGYAEADLLGQDLFSLFPRFQGTALDMALRETVATGRTQYMALTQYSTRSDSWLDAQFSRVGDGVLMTFMDVTEQHKAQLAQKHQSDLIQVIIDAQPSGLVLYAPVREEKGDKLLGRIIDFTYVLVNETKRRVTGRSDQELIGKRLLPISPSDQEKAFFDRLVAVAETGQTRDWIFPHITDGFQSWFQASLIRHGDQVLFTFLDVSVLKRQKKDLEAANTDLRRSNENLQQFAYVASHDLQEPLRKIQAFGDLLLHQYADTLGEGVDYLQRMQNAAGRMSLLIRDLLAFTRISTQREISSLTDLNEVVNLAMNDLDMLIQETGALVEIDQLPTVSGDASQLGQLFQNLLSNAIKFRQDGVTPIIRIHTTQLTAAHLPSVVKPASSTSVYYRTDVLDNGIGFEQRYADRIFQVFQRLHGKNVYAGTGIGLAICNKVAVNHGGAVTATSQPGQGAMFSVYLPTM